MMKSVGVLFLVCISAIALTAQTDAGSLAGRLTDSTGAAVPGAVVRIRNSATSLQREAVADEQGVYQANLLPPDPAFSTQTRRWPARSD
jgi:hypothetical protein